MGRQFLELHRRSDLINFFPPPYTGDYLYSAIIYLDMGVFCYSAQPNFIFRNYLFGNGTFHRNALAKFYISQLFVSRNSYLSIPNFIFRNYLFGFGGNLKTALAELYISHYFPPRCQTINLETSLRTTWENPNINNPLYIQCVYLYIYRYIYIYVYIYIYIHTSCLISSCTLLSFT